MAVAVAVVVVVEKVRRVWENWLVVRYKDREVAIVLGGGEEDSGADDAALHG